MAKFTDSQIKFIDDLLLRASGGDVIYSDLNYSQYDKIFPFVNKDPYHLFDSDGERIWLSQLGNEINNNFKGSFKSYLDYEKSKVDLDKEVKKSTIKNNFWSQRHTRISLVFTFCLLIIALLTYKIKYSENKNNNKQIGINPSMLTNDSTKINHLLNKNTISVDSILTKMIPDSSKH